ncbi:MAG: NAD-dependent epimerase/dehydratase family protein [Desulfovibrionaceae bacterium]
MDASFLQGARVLVTGGTGFVGRHLLPELVRAGAEITCLARASSNISHLPRGVRVVRASLTTGEGLEDALAGQDMAVHLAALLFGLGWQDYLRANARAADMLARAAAGVPSLRRLVLVSSLAATGPCGSAPGVGDDTVPAPVSAYGWSKFMAEQTFARHLGDRLVILRPAIIYGSGDRGLLPCFQGARRGVLVVPGLRRPFPVSAVHARDMAQAVIAALKPQAHGVYHVSDGREYTMREFNEAMAAAVGRRARVLGLPLPIMAATAALASLAGNLGLCGRRPPSWNWDKYREARQEGWLCDASRLRGELGFAPAMTLQAGMAEAVAGYRKEGWL